MVSYFMTQFLAYNRVTYTTLDTNRIVYVYILYKIMSIIHAPNAFGKHTGAMIEIQRKLIRVFYCVSSYIILWLLYYYNIVSHLSDEKDDDYLVAVNSE